MSPYPAAVSDNNLQTIITQIHHNVSSGPWSHAQQLPCKRFLNILLDDTLQLANPELFAVALLRDVAQGGVRDGQLQTHGVCQAMF